MLTDRSAILLASLAFLALTTGPAPTAFAQDETETVRTPAENVGAGAVRERRPGWFVDEGIQRHLAFKNRAFQQTPAQRAETQDNADAALEDLLSGLGEGGDFLGSVLPLLVSQLLDTLMQDFVLPRLGLELPTIPADLGGTPTPPQSDSTREGIAVLLTANDTTLRVGQETTVYVWVEQASPNATRDNGIAVVALNIETTASGVVEAQVPVAVAELWQNFLFDVQRGTARSDGGIDRVVAGVITTQGGDRTVGLDGPVEVFRFTVRGVGPGTVDLVPTNFNGEGFRGVTDFDGNTGDENNYESLTLTVQ